MQSGINVLFSAAGATCNLLNWRRARQFQEDYCKYSIMSKWENGSKRAWR